MKKLCMTLLLLSPTFAFAKVKDSDYSLSIHVLSSRLTTDCHEVLAHPYCTNKQDLQVVIAGQRFELLGKEDADNALRTGDYKSRAIVDNASANGNPIPNYEINYNTTYEFLFADGKKQRYSVIGQSE
jgi:hypothetical protein